jgi:hypothetical protein
MYVQDKCCAFGFLCLYYLTVCMVSRRGMYNQKSLKCVIKKFNFSSYEHDKRPLVVIY